MFKFLILEVLPVACRNLGFGPRRKTHVLGHRVEPLGVTTTLRLLSLPPLSDDSLGTPMTNSVWFPNYDLVEVVAE